MQDKNYNVSVNIIRDYDRELTYYRTPNAERVVNQLVNDFKKGVRSFTIIGSYGTGKSSLLWAFQQSLNKKNRDLFEVNLISNPKVQFVNFIGEYKSMIDTFSDAFGVINTQDQQKYILSEIFNQYHDLGKNSGNPLLILVIDEFGKFLEYAVKNEPEKELYFIQQLAEFVNNPDYNICLITTIHQSFDAYGNGLDRTQKQEWIKVKGRFQEITFNEPVEQLLYLASQHINAQQTVNSEEIIYNALQIARETKAFRFEKKIEDEQNIASKLFPLEIMSANALTLCLQKYGQNERSLFSFLASQDYTGISHFKTSEAKPFYHVAKVYDYMIHNFHSFLNSKDNPDYTNWAGIKIALEKVEGFYRDDIEIYRDLIKTIGLLGMTTSRGAILNDSFLTEYGRICLRIKNVTPYIDSLVHKKVIVKREYNRRYVLLDGTDLDINLAIIEAGSKVEKITDITTLLKRYYNLSPVLAKMYSFHYGTPRLFDYIISELPTHKEPKEEIDGFINLIFNESLSLDEVKEHSKIEEEAIIYGFYTNVNTIKELLFEIQKIQKVIEENTEDNTAIKELNSIKAYSEQLLNNSILDAFFTQDVTWIFKGYEHKISNRKEFNKFLSQVCIEIYPKTPVFKNELVNKHKISGSIHTAKKYFTNQLINCWNLPNLGFDAEHFPPQKMIYLTLIKENGLELHSGESNFISEVSKESTFRELWEYCNSFLHKSRNSSRKVSELMELLTKRPFKLKQGLIDFWVITYLFTKRNDFALFGDGVYIPDISKDILDLIMKAPHRYEIKAFDLEGVKLDLFNRYRILINKGTEDRLSNDLFIETIKPFIVFFSELPFYAKNTKRLNKETITIRETIAKSKDPEKTFFEDFPIALGYSIESLQSSEDSLENYANRLQEAIREMRVSFSELVARFENMILADFIGKTIPFEDYRKQLQDRYKNLHKSLLLTNQKTFIQRIDSPLDDQTMWLSSIAQALTGKSLDMFRDEDEVLLHDRFKRMILDLDTLTTISKTDIDNEKEEMISLEISSFVDGVKKSLVRFPKSKQPQITKMEGTIREQLSGDNSMDIAALTNLLKELLNK
ncbi:MAG: hypothetical protein V4585_07195 [Bacteroidota bacterium]